MISGFRRNVNEIWTLLGCYSVCSGNLPGRFGTTYRSHLQASYCHAHFLFNCREKLFIRNCPWFVFFFSFERASKDRNINCILRKLIVCVNLLKPTCYVMHQQFNIQQLYALPTLYLCVLYLSQNKQRFVPLTV